VSTFGRLLGLELRRLWRARTTRIVLAAVIALESSAMILGVALTIDQRDLAARDVAAGRARIAQLAKGAGEASALELGIFQDTTIARGINGSSGWVAADLAALPDTAVIKIDEPPVHVPAVAERSPAAAVLGTWDLAWFWALLLPLAAIILGYSAIAEDRERGLWAMLPLAKGGAFRLIAARWLALWLLLGIATLVPLPIGSVLAPIFVDRPFEPLAAIAMTIVGASYLAFVTAAVIAVSAASRRSVSALAGCLFAYLLAALAIPVSASSLVRLATPEPDPRARLIGEQAAAEVYARPSAAVLAAELERRPMLAPDRGTDGATSQNRTYLLLAAERHRRFEGARFAETRRSAEQADLLSWARWLSPITVATGALAELGGTGPSERIEQTRDAERFRKLLLDFVTTRVIANEGALPDPDQWPVIDRRPRTDVAGALLAALALSLSAVAAMGMALIAGARASPALR
jgi:ABC-type transport system involved in multi-copper enzyme maturation permease subunit